MSDSSQRHTQASKMVGNGNDIGQAPPSVGAMPMLPVLPDLGRTQSLKTYLREGR